MNMITERSNNRRHFPVVARNKLTVYFICSPTPTDRHVTGSDGTREEKILKRKGAILPGHPRLPSAFLFLFLVLLAPGAEDGTASDANAGRIAAAGRRTHT